MSFDCRRLNYPRAWDLTPQNHHQSTKKMKENQEGQETAQKDGYGTTGGAGTGQRTPVVKEENWMPYPKEKEKPRAKARMDGEDGMAKAKVKEAKAKEEERTTKEKEDARARGQEWKWTQIAKEDWHCGKEIGLL